MDWFKRAVLTSLMFQVTTGQLVIVQNVRLVGGNSTAGRVEVMISGTWGTVCDDSWENEDAGVVCKTLNLTGGVAVTRAGFGQGVGLILMDDVYCAGNENHLRECSFVTGSTVNCDHSEDAGVVCQPAGTQPASTPPTTTLRPGISQPGNCSRQGATVQLLVSQANDSFGYVQAQAPNGTFGFVCDDGWDVNAAKVVCKQLCYTDLSYVEPGMQRTSIFSLPDPVPFALDDIHCLGTEGTLADCTHQAWFSHNCASTELASVTCAPVQYSAPPPPSPDLQCRAGDLIAVFDKSRDPNLEAKHLHVANMTQECPQFRVTEDASVITARIPFDDCATRVRQNQTHIIYSNTIYMESTSRQGAISRSNEYLIELTCEMARNGSVDKDFRPLTQAVTQRTEGQFVITLRIYEDQYFNNETASYPFQLDLGEWLNTAVDLESIDSRLKLVVTDCRARANLTDPSAPTWPLLQNKCASSDDTTEVYPLSNVKVGVRFQSFKFVGYPFVILECEAIVCLSSENNSQCDRSCNNSKPQQPTGRRRRQMLLASGSGLRDKEVYRVFSPLVRLRDNRHTASAAPLFTTKPALPLVTTLSERYSASQSAQPTTTTARERPANQGGIASSKGSSSIPVEKSLSVVYDSLNLQNVLDGSSGVVCMPPLPLLISLLATLTIVLIWC